VPLQTFGTAGARDHAASPEQPPEEGTKMNPEQERKAKARRVRAGASCVDQQRDADDALQRERGPSDRMRMPHERDESPVQNAASADKTPGQRETMERARRDIESGKQDTDCHSQPNASPACPGTGEGRS